MSNSLRDQLLKAGLVSKDQANRAEAKARRKQKPRKGPESDAQRQQREMAAQLARAEAEKQARDKELNRKRDQTRAAKARRAEMRKQLAEQKKNDGKGEITHHFQSGKKVKQVMVTAAQQAELIAGTLAIVVMDGNIHLVDRKLAEAAAEADPEARVIVNDPNQVEEIDEAYKDYVIPDDLQW